MEMKEIYIAPEVEILCFQPMEALASFLTSTWNWPGSGELGDDENQQPGFESTTPGGGGEGEEDVEDA